MIGTIDITVNAEHPNVPLSPVFSWRGSASRINVEGVPSLCGSWYVASVSIAVSTPDGKTVTYPCQRSCNGIYSATIAATETPGKSANGITISATDEEGKDFVLGRGDLYILDGAAIPSPGDVSWTVRLLDKKPENPRDGDAYFAEDGTLLVYSGGEWRKPMPSNAVPTKLSQLENDMGFVTSSSNVFLPITGGTLTGDLAVGEEHTASRKLTVAAENGAAGITLQGGTGTGLGSSITVGSSSSSGGSLTVQGGGSGGGAIFVSGGAYDSGRIVVGNATGVGTAASIKKGDKEVATEEYVDGKVDGVDMRIAGVEARKADRSDVYTKAEADEKLASKADKATPSASAALLADNAVALVDGSAGGETAISFKPPSGNTLRYCELMLTGVASDGAVTLVLPAGTYQFADGADSVPKGNSHFCFAEYARGKWLVTRQSTTEKAVEEAGA